MKNITEAQYDQLCDACDALLQNNSLSFERNANAFLHVIREHPIFLQGYNALFHKSNTGFSLFLIKLLFRHITFGSIKFLHAIYRNYFLRDGRIKEETVFENLFISHFLNHSFVDHKSDFYFFDLPQKISEKEDASLQLYINFTGLSTRIIKGKWKDRSINSSLLPKYLSLFQEIKIRALMLREAVLLSRLKASSKFEKRVKYQAMIACFSSSSHSNYRLAFLVQQYVKENGIKRIFTTYEGHPWERLIFAMAREVNPAVECIGYQHALVFRKQHAIRRKLAANFEPNYILCSGDHGRQQFEMINYLPPDQLLCFGTTRTIEEKRNQLAVEAKERNVFLMLSEGDLIECLPLAKFVIQLAKVNPNAQFIMRFHPITRVENVLKAIPELVSPSKNIELSNLSFEEDLERSHFAIYRGSTTIIKAIQYGLVPLYYEREDELSIDPLYGIQNEKINLISLNDLEIVLKVSHQELIKRQHKLIAYVARFFSPIDYKEALKILDK